MFLFLILDVDTQVNKQVFFLFRSVMKNAPQHTCPQVAGFGITDEKLSRNRLQFTRGAVATVVVLIIVILIMTFIIIITIIRTTDNSSDINNSDLKSRMESIFLNKWYFKWFWCDYFLKMH